MTGDRTTREKPLFYRLFGRARGATSAARGGAALGPFPYAHNAAVRDRSWAA
jgi:hypothetical protein